MNFLDLADEDLLPEDLLPGDVMHPGEKTAALRTVNPLEGLEWKRWRNRDEKGRYFPVPLVDGDDPEKAGDIEAQWNQQVVATITDKLEPEFGIAPTALMLTSLFGPFNASRQERANNVLLAQYDNIRIYYSGEWLSPLHINLLAALLNSYVLAEEGARNFDRSVTIDRDALVWYLFGMGASREGGVGGRSQYYDNQVSEMFRQLREGAVKIVEGGDDVGTPGKGKGFISNFLSRFDWDEENRTFTYAIDHRISNLFALNRHTYIFVRERTQFASQRDVDEVTIDLQNKFRSTAKKCPGGKTTTIRLGDLKLMMGAERWSFKPLVERVILAATRLHDGLVNVCTITGFDVNDEITLSKTSEKDSNNLVGLTFEEAKKIVQSSNGAGRRLSARRRDRKVNSERLKSLGLSVGRDIRMEQCKSTPVAKRPSRRKVDMPEDVAELFNEGKKKFGRAFSESIEKALDRYIYMSKQVLPGLPQTKTPEEVQAYVVFMNRTFRFAVEQTLDSLESKKGAAKSA